MEFSLKNYEIYQIISFIGIGGEKCDQCDRGFVFGDKSMITEQDPVLTKYIPQGQTPSCNPCGECFSNWDRILSELKVQTEEEVKKANHVKVTGSTGAHHLLFEDIESKMREIDSILAGASITNEELEEVQNEINKISEALKGTTIELDDLDSSLADTKQAIGQVC